MTSASTLFPLPPPLLLVLLVMVFPHICTESSQHRASNSSHDALAHRIPDQTAGDCPNRGAADATAGSVEAVDEAARRGAGSRSGAFVGFGAVLAVVMALVMTASVGLAVVVR